MNRISLDNRLERIGRDGLSDPDVAESVLRGVVDVTMSDLLVEDNNIKSLAEALDIDVDTASALTYGEVAVRIHDLWEQGETQRESAVDALVMLVRPYLAEQRRR